MKYDLRIKIPSSLPLSLLELPAKRYKYRLAIFKHDLREFINEEDNGLWFFQKLRCMQPASLAILKANLKPTVSFQINKVEKLPDIIELEPSLLSPSHKPFSSIKEEDQNAMFMAKTIGLADVITCFVTDASTKQGSRGYIAFVKLISGTLLRESGHLSWLFSLNDGYAKKIVDEWLSIKNNSFFTKENVFGMFSSCSIYYKYKEPE